MRNVLRPVVSRTMSWVSTTVTRASLARRLLTSISVHSSACSGAAAARNTAAASTGTPGRMAHHAIAEARGRPAKGSRAERGSRARNGMRGCGTVGYADVMPRARRHPGRHLARHRDAGPARRRTLRLRRHQHAHLLPAVVPVAPAAPRSRAPVPEPGGRRSGRLPRLPPLPSGRRRRPVGDRPRRRARPPADRRARRRRSRRPPHPGRARAPPAASARSTCSGRFAGWSAPRRRPTPTSAGRRGCARASRKESP